MTEQDLAILVGGKGLTNLELYEYLKDSDIDILFRYAEEIHLI